MVWYFRYGIFDFCSNERNASFEGGRERGIAMQSILNKIKLLQYESGNRNSTQSSRLEAIKWHEYASLIRFGILVSIAACFNRLWVNTKSRYIGVAYILTYNTILWSNGCYNTNSFFPFFSSIMNHRLQMRLLRKCFVYHCFVCSRQTVYDWQRRLDKFRFL